jgi:surface protein
MFENSKFNQPIGNWNVKKVNNMNSMFRDGQFNQNISKWCVTGITSPPMDFSSNSPLNPENKPKWGTCPD